MQINSLYSFSRAVPRFPFKGLRAPKMNIASAFLRNTLMISLLSQVSQACHRRCHMQNHNNIIAVTGVTGENQHIAHVRARARVSSLHYILIIIKNTCSTCDRIKIIDVSPVTVACDTLFHL
jgi:hypothetical protein